MNSPYPQEGPLPDCVLPTGSSQYPHPRPPIFYLSILLWKANIQSQLATYSSGGPLSQCRCPGKVALAWEVGKQVYCSETPDKPHPSLPLLLQP